MNMVLPNEGKLALLDWLLVNDGTTLPDLEVVLYSNNYTPVNSSVLADFVDATFTGADPIAVLRADWTAPTIVSNVAYTEQTVAPEWTCSGGGPETVYGWVLYDPVALVAIAAQRFDSARVMDTGAVEALDPFKFGLKTLV